MQLKPESTDPIAAEVADRFGVSRTHVRDLVTEAEAAGLLQSSGGSHLKVTSELWRLADTWIADCMDLFMRCCGRALPAAGG